jgi:hypothetical protein
VADIFLLKELGAFAESDGTGLRITQRSVMAAAREGWSANQILNVLLRVQDKPAPANITRRIKTWAGHYGGAAIEQVILLQLDSAEILDEMSHDPEIGPLLRPFLAAGPVAIVRETDIPRLKELLVARNMDVSDHLTIP